MNVRTVIIAPHLDDAVFSCWHVLAGPGAAVVTVFGGIPPKGTRTLWDSICGTPDGVEMMVKRLQENAEVLDASGIMHSELDYLDQQYRKSRADPEAIAEKVRAAYPDTTQFIAPLALGWPYRHPDHVLVRDVGKYLSAMGFKVAYYADMPYMKTNSTPSQLKSLSGKATRLLGSRYIARVVPLSATEQQRKSQAMSNYSSQFRMTNLVALGRLSNGRQQGQEVEIIQAD